MNILVTGYSGQIGTNLGLALLARGENVLGIDKRANAWTDRFPTNIAELHTPEGAAQMRTLAMEFKPRVVVHLAAWAKVHQLVKEPEKAFENVAMMQGALIAARESGAAFVFGSSREVYGDVIRNLTHESMTDFVVAESPYSASKIAGEAFVSSFSRCYRVPTLVFRFSNVYGRYDNDLARMERVIPLFVRNIWQEKPITVFGRDKMLDFTYIDDCIAGITAGIDALLNESGPPLVRDQTINLACGEGHTLFELVSLIEIATGKKSRATYLPSQTGEVTRYVADITKARALLNYAPLTPLAQGIPKYVDWCKASGFLR
jgi:UDP-glucuronate 4-epimerase